MGQRPVTPRYTSPPPSAASRSPPAEPRASPASPRTVPPTAESQRSVSPTLTDGWLRLRAVGGAKSPRGRCVRVPAAGVKVCGMVIRLLGQGVKILRVRAFFLGADGLAARPA